MKLTTFLTVVLSLLFTQAVFADKVEPPKDAVAFVATTTKLSSIPTAPGGKLNSPVMISAASLW